VSYILSGVQHPFSKALAREVRKKTRSLFQRVPGIEWRERGMRNSISAAVYMTIISVVLTACAGTKLVAAWKDETYRAYPGKVFVIGLSDERGPRSLVEDEFVRQLKARRTDAIASYMVFTSETKPAKDAVLAKAGEMGADAIMVVRFLKKEMGDSHTPLRRYAVPQGFDTSWDAYYGGTVTDVAVRDISYDYDVITMETTLYDTATRKPIWSALSQTTYQGGAIKQIKPFTSAIVKELAHENLVR
jgi:hypothetical protein